MVLPCMPFNVVFGRSAILPQNVLFDHHKHSEVHDATMRVIEHSVWSFFTMLYLMATYIHKSAMLPCLPFNLVFGRSAIVPEDV